MANHNHDLSKRPLNASEFRALAEFRHLIRVFLNGSEQAARDADLEPQQYMLLLALRGLPLGRQASIRTLAERMRLRHHSVVELVDRLERQQLLRRERSKTDRRHVIVHLTHRGEGILSRLASQRIDELRTNAPALVRALSEVIRSMRVNDSRRAHLKHHTRPAKKRRVGARMRRERRA